MQMDGMDQIPQCSLRFFSELFEMHNLQILTSLVERSTFSIVSLDCNKKRKVFFYGQMSSLSHKISLERNV